MDDGVKFDGGDPNTLSMGTMETSTSKKDLRLFYYQFIYHERVSFSKIRT